MSPEEWERKMEFILEHQAQFAIGIEKLFESDKRLREADERLRESQVTLTASVLRIADLVEDLTEAQKGTDERLNVLVNVVEKHITGPDHGGKSQTR